MIKLIICHNINKFYHIFGDIIGVVPTYTKLRDLNNTDFLLGVEFDIIKALDTYKYGFTEKDHKTYAWLKKLYEQIAIVREAHKPKYKTLIFAVILVLAVGFIVGRTYTIRQAELSETTNNGYFINFGNEVHEYTFEEVK